MTLRQCWEYALIECNKLKAPSILLEDFIYLFNKAIQQYVNSVYNRAEYNQQSSDDLSFLQAISVIDAKNIEPKIEFNDTIWELELPKNYVHLLNCMAEFEGADSKSRCGEIVRTITSPCQRLTADMYPGIINNYYMRPSHKKPYYYIVNRNQSLSADPVIPSDPGQDLEEEDNPPLILLQSAEDLSSGLVVSPVEEVVYPSNVKIEIHSGNSQWALNKLYITYLKAPKYYTMTQSDLLDIADNTPKLEFPDYVCYEIINIYVRLFLENVSDPRLQTNVPINQTIAVPGNN